MTRACITAYPANKSHVQPCPDMLMAASSAHVAAEQPHLPNAPRCHSSWLSVSAPTGVLRADPLLMCCLTCVAVHGVVLLLLGPGVPPPPVCALWS